MFNFLLFFLLSSTISCTNQLRGNAILCRRCGTTVTTSSHQHNIGNHNKNEIKILPEISPDAELTRFRSPTSVSFDIVTFKRATNVVIRGGKTEKDRETFFPPFNMVPIFCKSCGAHVGWKLVADRNKDSTCPMKIDIPPMKPIDLSGSVHMSAAAAAAATTSTSTSTQTTEQRSIKDILSNLQGFCSTKQTGFWVYEWCFQRHVRQFHLEPYVADATTSSLPKGGSLVTVAGTKYLKHPDWSLGGWKRAAHVSKQGRKDHLWPDTRKKGETKEPKFVSHLHVSGQKCDETKDGRRTEVRLICCDTTASEKKDDDAKKKDKDQKKDSETKTKPNGKAAWQGVSIRSILETSMCRYRMEVCVPALCQRDDFRPPSMGKPPPTKEEKIVEQIQVYKESQNKCIFYGLIWNRLLLQSDIKSYDWIVSTTPIVGVRRER